MDKWTQTQIGPQIGKVAIVTGGTDGIGLEISRHLAQNGARVIMAADDELKGKRAERQLRSDIGSNNIMYEYLNLADLDSVEDFAFRMKEQLGKLNILVNNAGVAAIPERMETIDGREMIFAVNYLGHFALTTHLFPLLRETIESRVIFQSSNEHRDAVMDFYDLEGNFSYDPDHAYAQSKLALMLFAFELHRRVQANHIDMKIIPVHPGAVRTHIFERGPYISGRRARTKNLLEKYLIKTFGQSASMGALPALFATTSHLAESGEYYGPGGLMGLRGTPDRAGIAPQANNKVAAEKLWEESERLSGVKFNIEQDNILTFPEGQKSSDFFPEYR